MTVELSDRFKRTKNYCIIFIFNLGRSKHVSPYFHQLFLHKLVQLRVYQQVKFLIGRSLFKLAYNISISRGELARSDGRGLVAGRVGVVVGDACVGACGRVV
ncbi:hypothetical protein J6590_090265 [Homalodisca vitripennis]|nr:hypothetical protein J6590_090265 [Homalodisca vitripennis]